jgi:hypothetical protein
MSGAFAYRLPCQLCPASEVAQLAHRDGSANSSLVARGGTPDGKVAGHSMQIRVSLPGGNPVERLHLQFADPPKALAQALFSRARHRSPLALARGR